MFHFFQKEMNKVADYSYDVEEGIDFAEKWQLMTIKIIINLEHHSAAVKGFIQIYLYLIYEYI